MSTFKLRFRQRKLTYLAMGLLMTLAAMPLVNAVSAAGIPMDITMGSRLVQGPGAPTEPKVTTNVQHGNTVQVAMVVHNPEDKDSDKVAKNFRVKVAIPTAAGTSAKITGEAKADNGVQQAPYNSTDSTTLNSANGKVFTVVNVRNVQVQENNVEPTNQPKYNWGPVQDVPQNRVQTQNANGSYNMTITPKASGDLKPCFHHALRIVFLVDIAQSPYLTIDKKVRKAGDPTFVDGPIVVGRNEELEYQIAVGNTGAARATELNVRDALPPNVTLVSGSCQMKVGSQPITSCTDMFVQGGENFPFIDPDSYVYFKIKVKTTAVPANVCRLTNAAMVDSKETIVFNDTATVTYVCVTPTPTPTPTPTGTPTATPTPTPTPTPTATPTPCIEITPTPGVTPSPEVSPTPTPEICESPTPGVTPTPTTPSDKTGGAPPAEELPKTGAAEAAMVSALALAVSGYLFVRERRNLKQELGKSKVKR